MSVSPSKEPELDPEAQSGEEQEHMDKDQQDAQAHHGEFEVKEQDRWLPIANVARIMKLALPENAKIAKEAKECMQDPLIPLIETSSLTVSTASEKCQQEKRKTVNGEDILFAMTSLGFENYAEALKIYLSKYREVECPQNPGSSHGNSQDEPRNRLKFIPSSFMLTRPQTQSARGENQRPPSAGYGAGGPSGAPGGAGAARPTGFSDAEGGNPMMNPNLDPSEQDASAYGYPAMVGQPHNGAGGESY
ncbi:Histone-fold [Penicillium bovifimosum]|uniref:Histone-fold n=1 Tax=Penicillium bovifimosum TaxID=126998 RepID=A0A9W9L8W7_9EURO|nr:Histone-fold [Penicillium bovifimosum]KAJ5142787.1 Histone-fold [Penicillium bovifimosum]